MRSSARSGSQRGHEDGAERHGAGQRDAVQQARDVRARRGHQDAVVRRRGRAPPAITRALYASVACVCSTPFGAPLEPEVHSTAASCSGSVQGSSTGSPIGQRVEVERPRCGRTASIAPRRPRRRRPGGGAAPRSRRGASTRGTRARPRAGWATATRPRRPARRPRRAVRRRRRRRRRAAPPGAAFVSSSSSVGSVPRAARPPVLRPRGRARTSVSSTVQARRCFQPSLAGVAPRSTLVPTKLRWISTVPAPMHSPRMSR